MFRKILIAVTICSNFISCGKSVSKEGLPVDNTDLIEINISIAPKNNNFSNIIEDVKFIPLETTDDIIIGNVDKIIFYNSEYYILDTRHTSAIYKFDSEGKFINRIGRKGRGPGEYLEPNDFIVNLSGVIVLNHFARNLMFYDHDGNYIKNVPLDYKIYEITGMDDESFIFAVAGDNSRASEVKDYEFIIIDMEGNLISKGIENKYRLNYSSGFKSYSYADKVLYYRPMNSMIYSVSQDSVHEKYRVNIEESPLPSDYEVKCSGNFEKFISDYRGKYNFFNGNLLENDDFLFFLIQTKNNTNLWNVYNKETREIITGDMIPKSKDVNFEASDMIVLGLNNSQTIFGNEFIGCLNAAYLTDETFTERYPMLSNIQEYDNPVIYHFQLKSSGQ